MDEDHDETGDDHTTCEGEDTNVEYLEPESIADNRSKTEKAGKGVDWLEINFKGSSTDRKDLITT